MWTLCKFFYLTGGNELSSPLVNDEVMSVYLEGIELDVDGDESFWNHIFLSLELSKLSARRNIEKKY